MNTQKIVEDILNDIKNYIKKEENNLSINNEFIKEINDNIDEIKKELQCYILDWIQSIKKTKLLNEIKQKWINTLEKENKNNNNEILQNLYSEYQNNCFLPCLWDENN